eukprot:3171807-Ditylum_brightwellii.AAC.1
MWGRQVTESLDDLSAKAERNSNKFSLLSNNIAEDIDGEVWSLCCKKPESLDDLSAKAER